MKIRIKKSSQRSKTPTQGTSGSAGFDLFSAEEKTVPPRSSTLIRTDGGFQILPGYFGKVYAHFSWAKRFTGVGGGVIDSEYRGSVLVMFFNFSDDWSRKNQGEKFAQIVFHRKANRVELEEVLEFEGKLLEVVVDLDRLMRNVEKKCE